MTPTAGEDVVPAESKDGMTGHQAVPNQAQSVRQLHFETVFSQCLLATVRQFPEEQ